ncbi:hypothetical protein HY2_04665 [Hyphomonas pacifica]|nr:hypothetical protein HY2_04665 [Hyphomonas pacifica]
MGCMSNKTTPLSKSQWDAIDKRILRADEDRWISSRYAPAEFRNTLTALYALAYELARVRLVVTEEGLGLIRFQWWRDAISEIEAGKVREHDVARALMEEVTAGRLKTRALQNLVDGYQAAFEEDDRDKEPEAWLALTAANVLAPIHDWGEEIREVAPFFAASRRSDSKAYGPIISPAPKPIRPAVAHFRLRKHYIEGRNPNALQKRLSILQAIRTGKV